MKLHHEDLTDQIIGSAIEVHQELGPGLLESAYEECLCWELQERGLSYQRQVDLPIVYKGVSLDCAYRRDILVEDQVLLELKSVDNILPIHIAQLMTYLRLKKIHVGLLMNFNVALLKDGITRRVL
jgi:GxxExxY protein